MPPGRGAGDRPSSRARRAPAGAESHSPEAQLRHDSPVSVAGGTGRAGARGTRLATHERATDDENPFNRERLVAVRQELDALVRRSFEETMDQIGASRAERSDRGRQCLQAVERLGFGG